MVKTWLHIDETFPDGANFISPHQKKKRKKISKIKKKEEKKTITEAKTDFVAVSRANIAVNRKKADMALNWYGDRETLKENWEKITMRFGNGDLVNVEIRGNLNSINWGFEEN